MGGRGNVTPEEFEKQIKSQYGAHADAILSGILIQRMPRQRRRQEESGRARLPGTPGPGLVCSPRKEKARPSNTSSITSHFARCRFRPWQRCAVCIPDPGRTARRAQTGGFETLRYDQLLLGQLRQKRRSERPRSPQVAGFCRERSKGDGVRCNPQRETSA